MDLTCASFNIDMSFTNLGGKGKRIVAAIENCDSKSGWAFSDTQADWWERLYKCAADSDGMT